MGLAGGEQIAHRGQIPIHGKDPVGRHQTAPGADAMGAQKLPQMRHVIVAKGQHPRARQFRAAQKAGMDQLVQQHEVIGAREGGDDACVCQIARAENAGSLRPLEGGEAALQRPQQGMLARDEPGGAGARPMLIQRPMGGGQHARIMGEAQIVVAGKADELAPRAQHMDPVEPLRGQQGAPQPCRFQSRQLAPCECVERVHGLSKGRGWP